MFKISKKVFAELAALHEAARAALGSYENKLAEIRDELSSEYDDKSERWQESDKGQEVRSWLDDIEQAASDAESIELPEVPPSEPS